MQFYMNIYNNMIIQEKVKKYLYTLEDNTNSSIEYHENKFNKQSKQFFEKIWRQIQQHSEIFIHFYHYDIVKKKLRYTKEVILMSESNIIKFLQTQLKFQQGIVKLWKNKFNHFKNQAAQILQDNLLRKSTTLECVIVKRKSQFMIRVNAIQLDYSGSIKKFMKMDEPDNNLEIVFPKQIINHLQQIIVDINKTSVKQPLLLLQIEQNYYKNIFRETDQLIEANSIQSSQKYRIKQGLKVDFRDSKGNRLQTFYSNPDCIGHFKGFSNQQQKQFIKNGSFDMCKICKEYIEKLTIDPIMDKIMRLPYNNECKPILYYPYINRFKFYDSKQNCYYYYNYYHFRDTIKKLSDCRVEVRLNAQYPQFQIFPITFSVDSELSIIRDPCRGRYCKHLAFCQLREIYKTKNKDNYKCRICNQTIAEIDLLYLSEVEIILQIARKQTQKGLQQAKLIIKNDKNENGKVKIICKPKNYDQVTIILDKIYRTLKDPYYIFDAKNYIFDEQEQEEIEQFNWGWMN